MHNAIHPRVITARAHVPDVVTKELAIAHHGDQRKVRLSSNFLTLMGFEPGKRHSVEVLERQEGIRCTFDVNGPQQVYSRQYTKRRNAPFEAVLEIKSKAVLDAAIPAFTERLHYTLRPGEILIRPLANRTFSIRRRLKVADNPFGAFVAMTAGVDARCLQDTGFDIQAVLEYRPPEARDTTDLTETGAINVLANARPRYLFNEDISTANWDRISEIMASAPQIAVLHLSLQCDDFSPAKRPAFKQKSLEDLTTSHDLVYDALRMIETVRPACVMVENVAPFQSAAEGQLLKTKLRKWGYHVTESVMSGKDFGGLTGRERFYLVASVWPDFAFPQPTGQRTIPVWPEIEQFLPACRDVSHSKALQDGLQLGRARLLKPGSVVAPTVLKSQARQAKDSLYIAMPDGSYRLPTLDMLRHLNGIPADFNLDCVAETIGSEIVGQSIQWEMHKAICKAIHDHIGANVGRHSVVAIAKQSPSENVLAPTQTLARQKRQLDLFH